MTHGPEYKTNGKRPVWLKDGDRVKVIEYNYGERVASVEIANAFCWRTARAIRLPADHWANRAIEAGLEPWAGGDEAPEDWDGGEVLLRCGERCVPCDWKNIDHDSDIIGYKKKEIAVSELPKDVTALVVAARKVWDDIDFITSDSDEGHKLDKALEAFSSRVPYEDEPHEIAVSEEVQDEYIEAARLFSYEGTDWPEGIGAWDTVEYVKKNTKVPFSRAVMELASMIQTYEPHRKPKDRDEEIAEKWAKRLSCGSKIATETILSAIKEAKS